MIVHTMPPNRFPFCSLYYQCSSQTLVGLCEALADVYYLFVRNFGGSDASPGKRDDSLMVEYEAKLAIYNELLAEAIAKGEAPDIII